MIFYISRNAMKNMSVHFVSNTIKTIVNYLNYAVSYTFPCKFMPNILGATSFLLFRVG